MNDRLPVMSNAAPVVLAIVLVLGFGWQFVYFEEDLPGFAPQDQIDNPNNSSSETFGFFDSFAGVINAIWDGIVLFTKFLTFTAVDGIGPREGSVLASFWEFFKWAWRVGVPGMFLWNVIDLAR